MWSLGRVALRLLACGEVLRDGREDNEDLDSDGDATRHHRLRARADRELAAVTGERQHIVVMGVSGCGKTTVGEQLAAALGWSFAEGDRYHPQANIDKMATGIPLTDEDRWPWLRILADRIGGEERPGRSSVLTCSSLRRSYRDLLRSGGGWV